jgi:hypothetical protein
MKFLNDILKKKVFINRLIIKYSAEQTQTLSKTRDVLLPKLMSGEIEVDF